MPQFPHTLHRRLPFHERPSAKMLRKPRPWWERGTAPSAEIPLSPTPLLCFKCALVPQGERDFLSCDSGRREVPRPQRRRLTVCAKRGPLDIWRFTLFAQYSKLGKNSSLSPRGRGRRERGMAPSAEIPLSPAPLLCFKCALVPRGERGFLSCDSGRREVLRP